MKAEQDDKSTDFSSRYGKKQSIEEKGLYCAILCPHCSHKLIVMIDVYLSPSARRHRRAGIQDFLSSEEWARFKQFSTLDRIVFGLGKFYEVYKQYPNEGQAKVFIGISRQTLSTYVNRTQLISISKQEREPTGRFAQKKLSLTDEGLSRYGELVYQVFGFSRNRKI